MCNLHDHYDPRFFQCSTYQVVDAKTGVSSQVQTGGLLACDIWQLNQPIGSTQSCPFWIKSWKADPGLSPQCLFTDYDQEASWYNVVGQYYEVGEFLQGVSILTLVLYFVTSSDSGSLVVDTLASNGRHEQNPLQRLLWAAVEGTLYWL